MSPPTLLQDAQLEGTQARGGSTESSWGEVSNSVCGTLRLGRAGLGCVWLSSAWGGDSLGAALPRTPGLVRFCFPGELTQLLPNPAALKGRRITHLHEGKVAVGPT